MMLSLCDLFFSYKRIFPGSGNSTLKVEKKRMLGIIFMQREHSETLRVQPTNHRSLRQGVMVTFSQPAAGRRVPSARLQGQALSPACVHQGPAQSKARLPMPRWYFRHLINRPWPGPLHWAGLHDCNPRKSLLVHVLNQGHLRPETRQGHPVLSYTSSSCFLYLCPAGAFLFLQCSIGHHHSFVSVLVLMWQNRLRTCSKGPCLDHIGQNPEVHRAGRRSGVGSTRCRSRGFRMSSCIVLGPTLDTNS